MSAAKGLTGAGEVSAEEGTRAAAAAENTLAKTLSARGFDCSGAVIETFRAYMELVLRWNEKVNLTAITDREQFIVRHFADSVLCADWPETTAARMVIDVGTGAGFPGVPLAIVLPEQSFTLIDSLGKRMRILEEIVARLGLRNVRLLCGRAEDLARDASLRGAFDLCVSRAVARLPVLAEYCLPFVTVGGCFFAYKGGAETAAADIGTPETERAAANPEPAEVAAFSRDALRLFAEGANGAVGRTENELAAAEHAISVLGGRLRALRDVSIEACGLRRRIVVVEKIGETPSKYPRRAGMPEKRPL
jgi:16S rRNA (guanine527-N7)-methyltransferase